MTGRELDKQLPICRPLLTQSRLKALIEYCPESGQFLWRESRGPRKKGQQAGGDFSVGCNTYRQIRVDGGFYYGHRLAWLYVTGVFPQAGEEVDHQDGDSTNNAWSNLRLVTSSGNKQNTSLRSDNRSGVVGVRWHKAAHKWSAEICLNRRSNHLGLFENFEDAVKARKKAEAANGFHVNHGRPPNRMECRD